MKIAAIEKHIYAPELNKAIFDNGITFDCPNVTSIREFREKYFKPMRRGKYATIIYTNENAPQLNRTYTGHCGDGYNSIKTTMVVLRNRHNVPGGKFIIKITTV